MRLQHLHKHGTVARCNRCFIDALHYNNRGGAVDVRTNRREQYNIAILQHKWPGCFKPHSTRGDNEVKFAWNMRCTSLGGTKEVAPRPFPQAVPDDLLNDPGDLVARTRARPKRARESDSEGWDETDESESECAASDSPSEWSDADSVPFQHIDEETITAIRCASCGSSDEDHVQCGPMLLCDRLVHAEHGPSGSMVPCNRGLHLGCMSPPLDRAPDGDWYCPQHVVISKRGRLSRPPTRLLVG